MTEATRDFHAATVTDHTVVSGDDLSELLAAAAFAADAGLPLWVAASDVPSYLDSEYARVAVTAPELEEMARHLLVAHLGDSDAVGIRGVLIVDGVAALVKAPYFAEAAAVVAARSDRYGIGIVYRS
jgi:hypothetical protein